MCKITFSRGFLPMILATYRYFSTLVFFFLTVFQVKIVLTIFNIFQYVFMKHMYEMNTDEKTWKS